MAALMIIVGPADPEHALRQVLASAELAPGPADLGDLLDAQLAAARPPDAYAWERTRDWSAIRLQPGGHGGLQPDLARALSSAAHGLVLAMEATRTRDRYLLGAFLAGRTLELHRCVEGVAEGARGRELCDEDALAAAFERWSAPYLGAVASHTLAVAPEGALLATGGEVDAGPEAARRRIAWLGGAGNVEVVESEDGGEPARTGEVAIVAIPADAPTVHWYRFSAGEAIGDAVADGYEPLAAALPAWAFRAPGYRSPTRPVATS